MTTIIIVEDGIVQGIIQVKGEDCFVIADFDDQSEEKLTIGITMAYNAEYFSPYLGSYHLDLDKIRKHPDMKKNMPEAVKAIEKVLAAKKEHTGE